MWILNWILCFPHCYQAACLAFPFLPVHFPSGLMLDFFSHCKVDGVICGCCSALEWLAMHTFIPIYIVSCHGKVAACYIFLNGTALKLKIALAHQWVTRMHSILSVSSAIVSLLPVCWSWSEIVAGYCQSGSSCWILSICQCASPIYSGEF